MRFTKYHAKKTVVDGIKFDSKRESEYYTKYKEQEDNGEIFQLTLQPRFELQPPFEKDGKKYRKVEYVADFMFKDAMGETHVVDVKGMITPVYKLKKKLFEYRYPQYHIEEVK